MNFRIFLTIVMVFGTANSIMLVLQKADNKMSDDGTKELAMTVVISAVVLFKAFIIFGLWNWI